MRCAGEGWLGNGRSKLLQVSFRLRLTLFFVLIVVLPMVALAVLVVQIAADSESGKADARLSAGLRTATTVYEQAQADSRRVAGEIAADVAADPAAVAALEGGDRATLRALADELATTWSPCGSPTTRATRSTESRARPVAAASVDLTADGGTIGAVAVSTTSSSRAARPDRAGDRARTRRWSGPTGRSPARSRSRPARCPRAANRRRSTAARGSCRVAATEPLGDEQAAGRPLRPRRRRGLPLLAAEGGDRGGRLPPAGARRDRPAPARPQGQIKEMLDRRTADRRRRLLRARSRSAATTRWPGWRASSTR